MRMSEAMRKATPDTPVRYCRECKWSQEATGFGSPSLVCTRWRHFGHFSTKYARYNETLCGELGSAWEAKEKVT